MSTFTQVGIQTEGTRKIVIMNTASKKEEKEHFKKEPERFWII